MASVYGTSGSDTIQFGVSSGGVVGAVTTGDDYVAGNGGNDYLSPYTGNDSVDAGFEAIIAGASARLGMAE